MDQIKQWYVGLEDNEQKIVLIVAIFFSLMILIFAVIKPINDSLNNIQQQINSREKSVALWKKTMPMLIANRGSVNNANSQTSLSNLVTSSTNRYQLKVSRVQEKNNNEMQVWFDNVPFNSFIRWVAELENTYKISVEAVNIRTKDRDGLSSIDIKIQQG